MPSRASWDKITLFEEFDTKGNRLLVVWQDGVCRQDAGSAQTWLFSKGWIIRSSVKEYS